MSPAPAMPAMSASISCSLTCAGGATRRGRQTTSGFGVCEAGGESRDAAAPSPAAQVQQGRRPSGTRLGGTAGRPNSTAQHGVSAAQQAERGKGLGLGWGGGGGGERPGTTGTTRNEQKGGRGGKQRETHRLVHHGQELFLVGVDRLQHGGLRLAQLLQPEQAQQGQRGRPSASDAACAVRMQVTRSAEIGQSMRGA